MKLTNDEGFRGAGRRMGQSLMVMGLVVMGLVGMAFGQAVSTTTVQGTVYLANGQAGAGTLDVSWPAFTTAQGQAVTAGRASVTIAPDGFVSVNLAPNLGAMPAGLYYTAIYHLSDGTTSTEYWVVPAAAQAALGQVRAQVMPAAQAVQTVSKAYVDQSISELTQSLLTASGGTLSGPLYLNGDPTQALQAADKHYVDSTFNMEVPLAGGNMTGPLTTPAVNGVQAPAAGTPQTTLQAAINAAGISGAMEIPPTYAGTDSFTNPNGVRVADLRSSGAQQAERSVKEFGAVCDGATDDTNALQSALNYARAHGVALTIPQGTCKTQTLNWHGESIGGLGKQVSALMGFPGQDVLAAATDSVNLLASTRLHDLTIYVDQSADVSCSPALGRMAAGTCALGRQMEKNSIFSPGGNGFAGTAGTGSGWAVGNCAIAMSATTGAGGNGLRNAVIENLEIAATGTDPMAAQYPGAHSTHTCGLFLGQWPQWSEFRNIDIRGLNTGIAIPALPGTVPAGLNADSNRWQNITIQTTHGFTAAAGSNNVLDNLVVLAANSAATAEPPTGLVLDLAGAQQGWTVRNAVVLPSWNAVQPQLAVAASGGAVTGVTAGPEHGLGFDPYGTQVPLKFSGSCTAAATASVNSDGSIGTVSVTQGGVGCSTTTTASVNVAGTWDTAAPVNLIGGQNMSFFAGNLLKGNGGYTVWNAAGSQSYGTQLDGGGGTLPGGGSYAALVANSGLGSAYQVDQFPGVDFGAKLQACLNMVSALYGGTCDARNFTGNVSMGSNLTISTGNTTVELPCATIATANQVIVTAGTRNVALRGCALRGGSTASGNQGGTVFQYSGAGAMVQVGDPSYAADTQGFHMDNAVISTTATSSATAQGLAAYRTQEMDLESLYFLGNPNQTGMTLDGTGNYTGGTFLDNAFNGFQTAVNAIGHQISNAATTDWLNASTFVRLHIDCPTSGGSPIAGTYGINLQQGDGNTFTGGDVEGCSTALHLGPNAQNNTLVGVRNENSNNQVVADAGSSYNNWMTGGTMFTGQLTDNGTRNSFLDTFHRAFNGLNGDWYGSQKDATVTNHYRIGTGAGNERGLLDRFQTDYGYRWTTGLSDATAGEQFYQVLDELNNVYRLSIGQYNNGQGSTNNQTVINAAGTGAVVLNGSNNAGTGGVVIGSGGASASTVATISNAGNAQFNGTLQVGGTAQATGTMTVRNNSDAEVDYYLWPGLTASQKGSFTYKDWNGNSQWYMVKDASNNWALNSATGGLDSFKAYQSTNSGDTYINASNASGVVRVNYETGAGAGFNIYGGNSSSLYASFTGTSAIKFPGLAAGSGHNCLQIDNSGYITNTGSACGTGSGGSGTVSSGNVGQIAYYAANGTAVSGTSAVPVTAGGTGATTAAGALAALGAQASIPGLSGDGKTTPGIQVPGSVAATTVVANGDISNISCAGTRDATDITAFRAKIAALTPGGGIIRIPSGTKCYIYATTGTEALLFTAPISLEGGGEIDFDIPAGMNKIRIAPANVTTYAGNYYYFNAVNWSGITIKGVTAPGVYATTGLHAIVLDSTNNDLSGWHLHHAHIEAGSGYAVYMVNADVYGGLYDSSISGNELLGGLWLQNSGDRNLISDNDIYGGLQPGTDGIFISSVTGATSTKIEHNMIHALGNPIHIGGSTNMLIKDNEIGIQSYGGAYSAAATVYLDGSNGSVNAPIIKDNLIGLDQALRTPAPSVPNILISQNVFGARISGGELEPTLGTAAIVNQGGDTGVDCQNPPQIVNGSNLQFLSSTGSMHSCDQFSIDSTRAHKVNYLQWSEDMTNAAWYKVQAGAALAPVVTQVSTVLPDGSTGYASRVVLSLGGGTTSSDESLLSQTVYGLSNPHPVTGCFWFKSADTNSYTFDAVTAISSQLVSAVPDAVVTGDGWRRMCLIVPATNNSTSDKLNFLLVGGVAGISPTANILIWGANLGVNTEYAKTTSAAINGYGVLASDLLGTVAAAALPVATTNAPGIVQPDGTTVNVSGGVISVPGGTTDAGCPSGYHYPCIIAKIAPTLYSGTAPTGLVTLVTPATAGQYRICGSLSIVAVGTAATGLDILRIFTRDGTVTSGGITPAPNVSSNMASTITTVGSQSDVCEPFYADAGQPIQAELYMTGVTGTPTFRYAVTLERLQ
jgi:hypothetical protein